VFLASMPKWRMGRPSEIRCREMGLHHGSGIGPTGYKVWRDDCAERGIPLIVHHDRTKRAVVLEAVKVWPGQRRSWSEQGGATGQPDIFCASPDGRLMVQSDEERNGFQIEPKILTRKKDAPTCRY